MSPYFTVTTAPQPAPPPHPLALLVRVAFWSALAWTVLPAILKPFEGLAIQ